MKVPSSYSICLDSGELKFKRVRKEKFALKRLKLWKISTCSGWLTPHISLR